MLNIEKDLSYLNTDVILCIGSFLNSQDVVRLTHVNQDVRANSDQLLRSKYQHVFGNINANQRPDKNTIIRLLCFAGRELNLEKDYNVYKVPSHLLERLKWMAGVENNVDAEVQANYDSSINLLENTKPVSIIQLKNKLLGFWHADCQIRDYNRDKSEEIKRATKGLFRRSFFACTKLFYRYFYNFFTPRVGKNMQSRSEETFAKIGGFHLNGKDYDVVAFHILTDYKVWYESKFKSVNGTRISFFEKGQFNHFRPRSNNSFNIRIGRERVDREDSDPIFEERDYYDRNFYVSNIKRHLCVHRLAYQDDTENATGSDRLLDQKLTQIMIEITMQNERIMSLRVTANKDSLLIAAGFKIPNSKKILEKLYKFRLDEENKLFPPNNQQNGTCNLIFKSEKVAKKIVYFSRGAPESWLEIIQREPILTQESGVLPEYWADKPIFIDKI